MARSLVAMLAIIRSVNVDGTDLTGPYLSGLVALNPHNLDAESITTPPLITEVGRVLAAAKRQKDLVELDYRIWRDGLVHKYTNDVAAAAAAGFESAASPGVDSKNNPKEPKTPSEKAVETWLRTQPEYRVHWEAQAAAEEAYAAVFATYEGAKARVWVARDLGTRGGALTKPGNAQSSDDVPEAVDVPEVYTPEPPARPATIPPPPSRTNVREVEPPPGIEEDATVAPPAPPPPPPRRGPPPPPTKKVN